MSSPGRQSLHVHLSVPGATGELEFRNIRSREAFSTPFVYEIEFACDDVDPSLAIGELASLVLRDETGSLERYFTGRIDDLTLSARDPESISPVTFQITLWPTAYNRLSYRHGFRIFQDLAAPDIIKDVFATAGLGESLFDWSRVVGTYGSRPFCVQYDETEWDFVNRLLEEEGIYYYFEHDASGHKMCFVDDRAQHALLDYEEIQYLGETRGDGLWELREASEVSIGRVTLDDYNPELYSGNLADRPLRCEASVSDVGDLEHYEFPGCYAEADRGAQLATRRLEALRVARTTIAAKSNLCDLEVGRRFRLVGHESTGGEFLLTQVSHLVEQDERDSLSLHLELSAIPSDVQYRAPLQTPKPRIAGIQTVRVTGPEGEEIHPDAQGRIKVIFPWDRLANPDDHSSAWIRTTHPMTNGSLLIPRVGWELIVAFRHGDPDQPIARGRLWNPHGPPHLSLPAEKAATSFGSMSSPGMTGCTDITLRDNAGAESLSIDTAHDLFTRTENDRSWECACNVRYDISHNRTVHIVGDDTITTGPEKSDIMGSVSETVGAERSVTVDQGVLIEVTKNFDLSAKSESITVGNPFSAILEALSAWALSEVMAMAQAGVASLAGSLADKLKGSSLLDATGISSLTNSLAPMMDAAMPVVSGLAQAAGPAAALIAGDDPMLNQVAQSLGAIASGQGAQAAAEVASDVLLDRQVASATAAASEELSEQVANAAGAVGGSESEAMMSALLSKAEEQGSSSSDSSEAATTTDGSGPTHTGQWFTEVAGNVKETLGSVMHVGGNGMEVTVGGSLDETISLGRIEHASMKEEVTGGTKIETVGAYSVDASKTIAITAAGGVGIYSVGGYSEKIGESHSLSADGTVTLSALKFEWKATNSITLKCGSCQVVLDSSGILVEGATELTLEASEIKQDPCVIGSP